jgi:5'-nucleotidase|tara:strand:- start:640 stop:1407 length:768 start_codon:yes stop_codon:yes gene_type:complete
MTILLSNDDGVHAEGLAVLAKTISTQHNIRVVAPDRDHSGASGSLTLGRPLKVTRSSSGFLAVDGTPTDSVHLGLSSLFQQQYGSDEQVEFKRVISGINTHENLGDDVLYSGTVAAAIEGRFLPSPAIAVSLVNRGNFFYDTAALVVLDVLRKTGAYQFPQRTVLNINVPDIPFDQLRGVKVTRLGHRAKGQDPHVVSDPRGHQRFWIALAGDGDDAGEGTDFHAVANNYVSVTPIHVDMTQYDVLNSMKTWLEE